MEGGFADRRGVKLHTLQDYLDGRVTTVAVAMDKNAFPYGTKLCIPELNRAFGRTIPFRVVDTGDAFRSKGTSRIDICTRTRKDAGANAVNRNLEIIACDP
jgi:3D (Asp-Asp-Asp) domain-containing protein